MHPCALAPSFPLQIQGNAILPQKRAGMELGNSNREGERKRREREREGEREKERERKGGTGPCMEI